MKRKSMGLALAAGLVLTGGTVQATAAKKPVVHHEQTVQNSFLKKLSADRMYNTIALLSKQPREAGTEGELKAVHYIENEFKKLGLKTKIQPFPIYDFKTNHAYAKIAGQDIEEKPYAFSGSGSGKVTAPLVYAGKAKPEEIGDVKGKIALVERGDIPFIEKIANVLAKGAAGVIMFNNSAEGNQFGQAGEGQNIPAVAITRASGLKLAEQLKTEQLIATLDVDIQKIEKTSYNVIASMKPTSKKTTGQVITIGSHHDSVHGGPGANDDASGVSAVLELARVLSKEKTDTEIRFLTFGSEERGLVGSSYYAAHLPKTDTDRMVAHFQMDMIGGRDAGKGKPAGGLIMYTIDGKKNLVTDLGAKYSYEIFKETIPYGELGRSDHQPFHELGIPSALFIHSPVEPWYHQPTDTLDKIDKKKLLQVAKIVGSSAYEIADPKSPAIVKYPFEDRPVD
ncbi:M28 family peptidase [Bacillus sp. MUM 13]|uniref:M28 family peptidase n=1 Tax=Bacillus sp. MUM 13 TaxID=1678001 RepID=UPI0008F57CED|nr:M28 family peptidase [Bacillus sp. MUM 13]OIK08673.1 aminopeptidase [Bacillus sp. MUM 13]